MEKIKALIVDDYPDSRDIIRDMLNTHFPQISVIGEAKSIKGAERLILEKNPHLVFPDIRMEDGTPSFGLLEKLYNKSYFKFKVIFVSGHRKTYADKVLDYTNIRFLDKPINKEKFREYVNDFLSFFEEKENTKEMRLFFDSMKTGQYKEICIVKPSGKTVYVPIKDILYIRANGSTSKVFVLNNEQPIFSKKSLKEFSEPLKRDFGFKGVGRRHTINELQIKEIADRKIFFNDGQYCMPSLRGLKKYQQEKLGEINKRPPKRNEIQKIIRWVRGIKRP